MAASPPAPTPAPVRVDPAGATVAARARDGVWANADPRRWDVHLIAEIAMALALSVVLGPLFIMFVPLRMPQGGSFSLEMVPLLFVAVRRGVVPGVVTGALYGCVQLLPALQPFIYHPAQVLLDYPLAFAAVGLPFYEVHLSNVYAREAFRHHSYLSALAAGVIVGLGSQGYEFALEAALTRLASRR